MCEPYEWTAHKVPPNREVGEVQGTVAGVGLGGMAREEVGVGNRIRAIVPYFRTQWVWARARARARVRPMARARIRARAGTEAGPYCRVMGCRAQTSRAHPVVAVLALLCRRRFTPPAREDRVSCGRLSREKDGIPLLGCGGQTKNRGGCLIARRRRSETRDSHVSSLGGRTRLPGGAARWGVVGLQQLRLAGRRLASSPGGACPEGSQR